MAKSNKPNSNILCSVCGSRVPANTSKCLVCGSPISKESADIKTSKTSADTNTSIQNSSYKNKVKISLPIVIILLIFFMSVGGGLVFVSMNALGRIEDPTPVPTETETPTPSLTPTITLPTATLTPLPSPTPFSYTVKSGDLCSGISIAFNVSVDSIIRENNLDQSCTIFEGVILLIPQPTPTPIPIATETPNSAQMTEIACNIQTYFVQSGDTLAYVSAFYQVPEEAIIVQNNLSSTGLFIGQQLRIPLCLRSAVGDATVTPTIAPPYPAPELLRPRNGESYSVDGEATINLQWSSVGELRENEFYQITIVDITGGSNQKIVEIAKETNFNVPILFAPPQGETRTYQWFVIPIAQIGFATTGEAIYVNGGPISNIGTFSWTNSNTP